MENTPSNDSSQAKDGKKQELEKDDAPLRIFSEPEKDDAPLRGIPVGLLTCLSEVQRVLKLSDERVGMWIKGGLPVHMQGGEKNPLIFTNSLWAFVKSDVDLGETPTAIRKRRMIERKKRKR